MTQIDYTYNRDLFNFSVLGLGPVSEIQIPVKLEDSKNHF